ncbi:hypothetical protein K2173_004794 [Erythroxylum novogranatense]|uniref:Uncharacterized protein n=1 Tax=Erythroxylum novogranatense TaxID=1862640 RepID=A0AAV8SKI3_9ROSI|nr:hypothetical protein K2173_004794 [Erythroxylum novogranatense]
MASFNIFRFRTSISAFIVLIFISSHSVLSFGSQDTDLLGQKPTAYEILRDYNFPVGLLPKGVVGYALDTSTGNFSAFLNGTCSFSLDGSYQLRYGSTIKGYISRGKLSSLEGVSVKLFFMWVDIIEVSRSGDDLQFSVGIAGAGFPVDNFAECPQCGCGVNCGNDMKVIKLRTSPFVSSS